MFASYAIYSGDGVCRGMVQSERWEDWVDPRRLRRPTFYRNGSSSKQRSEIAGSELTNPEAAQVYTRVLGKPVKFQKLSVYRKAISRAAGNCDAAPRGSAIARRLEIHVIDGGIACAFCVVRDAGCPGGIVIRRSRVMRPQSVNVAPVGHNGGLPVFARVVA